MEKREEIEEYINSIDDSMIRMILTLLTGKDESWMRRLVGVKYLEYLIAGFCCTCGAIMAFLIIWCVAVLLK